MSCYPDGTSNQSQMFAITESATVSVAWITGF